MKIISTNPRQLLLNLGCGSGFLLSLLCLVLFPAGACNQSQQLSRQGDLAIVSVVTRITWRREGIAPPKIVDFLVTVVNCGNSDFSGDFVISVRAIDNPTKHQFLSQPKSPPLEAGKMTIVTIPERPEVQGKDLIFTIESERAFAARFKDKDLTDNSFRLRR